MFVPQWPEMKNPAHRRKTYRMDRPLATHWDIVDCRTAAGRGDCQDYVNGFVMEIPADFDAEQNEAAFTQCGYTFTKIHARQPGHRAYYFAPEQQCMNSRRAPHRVPREREPLFSIVEGDHRGNPRGTPPLILPGQDWLDNFANHQDKIVSKIKEG